MGTLFTLILLFIIGFIIFGILQPHYKIINRWQHPFDQFQFSSQEFYDAAKAAIAKRGMPDMRVIRVTYQETFVFGKSRDYLRFERGTYVFDVCAAPFGTCFYVSWWFQSKVTLWRRMLFAIPFTRWFLSVRTFREMDTESMFCALVHNSVLEAIDHVTIPKGYRIADPERSIKESSLIDL